MAAATARQPAAAYRARRRTSIVSFRFSSHTRSRDSSRAGSCASSRAGGAEAVLGCRVPGEFGLREGVAISSN